MLSLLIAFLMNIKNKMMDSESKHAYNLLL